MNRRKDKQRFMKINVFTVTDRYHFADIVSSFLISFNQQIDAENSSRDAKLFFLTTFIVCYVFGNMRCVSLINDLSYFINT